MEEEKVTKIEEEVLEQQDKVEEPVEVAPAVLEETDEVKKEADIESPEVVVEEPRELISFNNDDEVLQNVENNRTEFNVFYGKTKKVNMLIMIISLVFIIIAVFISSGQSQYFAIVLVLVVAYFGVTYFYSKKTRTKLDAMVQTYIRNYAFAIDSYVFNSEDFSKIIIKHDDKYDQQHLVDHNIMKNIHHIGSRDLVSGLISKTEFTVCDCVVHVSVPDSKKTKPTFLGKLFDLNVKIATEGCRTAIYYKGQETVGLDTLEGLELVVIDGLNENYVVHSNDPKVKKIVNSTLIAALNNITYDATLIDMFINIDDSKTFIGLSYGDDLMVIPLLKACIKEPITKYYGDVQSVVAIVKSLETVK